MWVVQGMDDLSLMLEVLDWDVGWEESVPHKEVKFREGTELDCFTVASTLGVFARSEAKVEAQGDQISNLTGLGVG